MKRKILYIAAVVMALSLIAGGTLAYFTVDDTARNVITSGGVKIELVEQQLVDGDLQPYPNEPIAILPATTVSKIVTVRGVEQAAWVRARYTVTALDAAGEPLDVSASKLKTAVVIEPDSENWIYSDGWWYCRAAVSAGESTQALFDEVCFSATGMDNAFQGGSVTVDVTVQAVQQANNGETVLDAAGWPAE